MAEVTRVLREMQLGNDGGLVPASGLAAVGEIGATNKAFGEIGFGKAEREVAVAGNKEATGTGMTKAASWSDFGTCGTNPAGNKLAAKAEGKREAVANGEGKRRPSAKEEGKPEEVAMVVTERVPDCFIKRVQTLPTLRPSPITEPFFLSRPKLLKKLETLDYNLNKLADLEQNVLRQVAAKGHADVVVKYDDGIKKIYPLPGY